MKYADSNHALYPAASSDERTPPFERTQVYLAAQEPMRTHLADFMRSDFSSPWAWRSCHSASHPGPTVATA